MKSLMIAALLVLSLTSYAQTDIFTVEQAVEYALQKNARIEASRNEVLALKAMQKASVDLPKTEATLIYGQYNSYARGDNNISVSQSIPFTVFGAQRGYHRAVAQAQESGSMITENEIAYQVKSAAIELLYQTELQKLLMKQDSIFAGFEKSATLRYKTGESNLLEQTTAGSQRSESMILLQQIRMEIKNIRLRLQYLLNSPGLPEITGQFPPRAMDVAPDSAAYRSSPALIYRTNQIAVRQREARLHRARLFPDLSVGFFSQTLIGTPDPESGNPATSNDRFTGVQIGIALPLWVSPHTARIRSAEFNVRAAEREYDYFAQSLRGDLLQTIEQINTHRSNLEFFNESALPGADLILKQAEVAFREGEIGYAEYLLGIRNALAIKKNYLKTVNDYNQGIIYLEYLTGKK
jgi:cobalt-zinc-cadmium resistance protein CzcA